MPFTTSDIPPFIDPVLIPQLPSYYNNTVRTNPGQTGGSISNNPNDSLPFNPDLLGLSDWIFGSSKPAFKPYVNAQGQYVYSDPSQRNPVPVANIPGAPLYPNKNYRKGAGNVQALYDLLPYLNQAVNAGQVPSAIAQLAASQATSPGYAQLMTQVYNTYGPQLNQIGNEILRRNALSQAETSNEVLMGPGKELIKNAYDAAQTFDKPYYDTRLTTANRLSDLLNSIDLSGALSPGERNEIAQGLARQNISRGTQNAPSATDTIANAMQYGQAGFARQQAAKSNLSQAISNASAFLPAAKSGVDVFQVATGRPSQANPGGALFPGVNTNTQGNANASFGLAGNILSGFNASDINQANINANKKDWLDQFNQFTSGLGNLTSAAGGAAGIICYVAREVFGNHSIKWKLFRRWLLEKSPIWFFKLYAKFGPQIATYIHTKPLIKSIIRKWMLQRILCYHNEH
jgi:hypothetical protein